MRVAFLTLASSGGASPRYRVYQYLPSLERAGIRCTVLPAVSPRTSARFYGRGSARAEAAYQALELATRLGQLARARNFDLVVVQKALLTVGLRGMHHVLRGSVHRLIVDIDDALHLGPPHQLPSWLRALEDTAQPSRLLKRAAQVIAGSGALAEAVRPLNPAVSVVPTSVETDRVVPPASRPRRVPVVGWLGSPSTGGYLDALAPALRRISRRERFVLRVVGAPPPRVPGVTVEARPWHARSELVELHGFDIGIMPLPDTPWARGKCGLKAVQYGAVALPTVCSPVGAATEIVRHGREGYLAATQQEWEDSLCALLADPGLRAEFGAAGRARAEERYSVRANAPRLASILEGSVV